MGDCQGLSRDWFLVGIEILRRGGDFLIVERNGLGEEVENARG